MKTLKELIKYIGIVVFLTVFVAGVSFVTGIVKDEYYSQGYIVANTSGDFLSVEEAEQFLSQNDIRLSLKKYYCLDRAEILQTLAKSKGYDLDKETLTPEEYENFFGKNTGRGHEVCSFIPLNEPTSKYIIDPGTYKIYLLNDNYKRGIGID